MGLLALPRKILFFFLSFLSLPGKSVSVEFNKFAGFVDIYYNGNVTGVKVHCAFLVVRVKKGELTVAVSGIFR